MIIKKNGKNYIIPNPKTTEGYKCYICGRTAEHTHHLIYGRGKRKISDQEKLTVALCNKCHWLIHNRHYKDKELKAMAQETWLKNKGGDTKENKELWYSMFYKFYDN